MFWPRIVHPDLRSYATMGTLIWLLQLRWVAVLGQLVTVLTVAGLLRLPIPVWPLLTMIGITAASNLGFGLWLTMLRRRGFSESDRLSGHRVPGGLMLLDLVSLTGMLYLTGGWQNPFFFFYFVNLAVAAVLLPSGWAWALTAVAITCCSVLLSYSWPLELFRGAAGAETSGAETRAAEVGGWPIERQGFWIGFTTCGCVVTYFITMLSRELRHREEQLAKSETQRMQARQLEGMATLAAGVGHELASPLSTIAVVAKELQRGLEGPCDPHTLATDVQLIRDELDRCREILQRIKSGAGEAAAERLDRITAQAVIEEVLIGLREPDRVQVSWSAGSDATAEAVWPVQALALAIRNLVQNALDASPPHQSVELQVELSPSLWRLSVQDRGSGMSGEVLKRVGDPFFTTKDPGRGMGMGLFLARNTVNRLGGQLDIDSELGGGTRCVVTLPVTLTRAASRG
jgi:two-component system, sensor histidine kinase RegB